MSASVDQHTSERLGEDASAPGASMRMYRVAEVMELLSLSRSVVYEQFRAGRLHSEARTLTAGPSIGRSRLHRAAAA